MKIVFSSRTGNVKKLISKLGLSESSIEIEENTHMSEDFILFTYTAQLGQVPEIVDQFLGKNDHHKFCKGVICSGNTNFGMNLFTRAADLINQNYGIPILKRLELAGLPRDVEEIKNILKEIDKNGNNIEPKNLSEIK